MALVSKFNRMCEKQRLVEELETAASSLSLWAQEKFREDHWSVADVKMALRNAARVCDGQATKFVIGYILMRNGEWMLIIFS